MADISLAAANVAYVSGNTQTANAGATITAGECIYLASGVWQLANAVTSAVVGAGTAIALNGGAAGQPIVGQTSGVITIGGTVAAAAVYVVSGNNAGGVAPVADVTTGWYTKVLGVGISTTQLQLILQGPTPLVAHA